MAGRRVRRWTEQNVRDYIASHVERAAMRLSVRIRFGGRR